MIFHNRTAFFTLIYLFLHLNFSFAQSNDSINFIFLKSVYDNNIDSTLNCIKHNAEINTKAEDGASALHYAVINNGTDMIILLAEHGANLEIKDRDGYTPLALACTKGNDTIAYLLITLGSDINATNNRKETPLHLAVLSANPYLVDLLLLFKADPNTSDYEGLTPLHLAAFNGSIETAELLINYGAQIQSVSNNGDKPIFMAIRSRNTEMTEYMLNKDTMYFNKNKQKQTILDIAFLEGNDENIQLIINAIEQRTSEKACINDSINGSRLWKQSLVNNNRPAIKLLKTHKIKRPWYPVFSSAAFRTGISWGINDLFWLYGFDFNEVNYRTHLSVGLGTRYWGNRYYFKHTNDTLFLLKEFRSFLWFDIKKYFLIYTPPYNGYRIELLAGLKSNFTWAQYSGLKEKEKIHADLIPEGGIKIAKRAVSWELTYQYWKYGGIDNNPHLVSLNFAVIVGHFKK